METLVRVKYSNRYGQVFTETTPVQRRILEPLRYKITDIVTSLGNSGSIVRLKTIKVTCMEVVNRKLPCRETVAIAS